MLPLPLSQTGEKRDERTRVGWKTPGKELICFGCYTVGDHILPNCKVGMPQYARVITNYEKLNADQKARIPDTSYKGAIALKRLYKPEG